MTQSREEAERCIVTVFFVCVFYPVVARYSGREGSGAAKTEYTTLWEITQVSNPLLATKTNPSYGSLAAN